MFNIQITQNAIEYMAAELDVGKDFAEELLITAISMCKFPSAAEQAVGAVETSPTKDGEELSGAKRDEQSNGQ